MRRLMKRDKKKPRGFSLVEMLVVVVLLALIVGAIFTQMDTAQQRYSVEDKRLDLTQQEREFIDQFTRDLHQAGFPNVGMYGQRLNLSSKYVSAGVWYISPTDVWMEGDLDDGERVLETRYHYDDGSTWPASAGPNPCPCIRRSSIPKVDGSYPWSQPAPVYATEVQNLIQVAGQPMFSAYYASGLPVTIPTGGVVLGSGTTIDQAAQNTLETIKAIRITLTTQSAIPDPNTHQPIQVTMTGTARLPNN
jgi:prepilin-type N-terminal cleavage/methylation domain-containing protein